MAAILSKGISSFLTKGIVSYKYEELSKSHFDIILSQIGEIHL